MTPEEEQAGAKRPGLGFSQIGAELPSIDWTLAELTGEWVESGQMINCPLPGHDDTTPSFNLWDDDENGVPQRYGCFGCERRGDVVGLIAEIEGISIGDAMRRAAELRAQEDGDTKPRPERKAPKPDKDLVKELEFIVAGFGPRQHQTITDFLEEKGFVGGEAQQEYVVDEWRWTSTNGAVVTPHYDVDDTLTGVKLRAGTKKWNIDGSRFPALYGSWRDKKRSRVVLCEGETDTVHAAFALRDEPVDVLGLPSGASQQIRPEWIEWLKGRELVLAFDADDEGMRAARRWCDARPGTLLARLPEGEDLLSCGIPVKELLERAEEPRRHSGMIIISEGVFSRHTDKGDIPVADFSFLPARELSTEEGPAWEGLISGNRTESLLRAADLHSASTMTKWANSNGRSWTGGSGPSVQGVFNFLTSASAFLPLETATTKAGKIGRSYVGPDFCVGADRVRYIPPAFGDAQLAGKIHVPRADWDVTAIPALEQMNDPATMAIILGWICATLLRGKRAPAPPLFISGESGAGKTNLLSTTLRSFGFGTETNLTTTTPFGVDCMVSSCVGFPVWFDEYRGGAREDSMQRLRQLLRDAYYGQPSMKGGMKTQTTELSEITTWAGIVVSGEMSSHETSHRDRIVMLDLDPNAKNKDAFVWLQDKQKTAGLGRAMLEFLSTRPDALFKITPQGRPELGDRFRDTMGFVQAGWDAWRGFRWEMGLRDKPVGPNLLMLEEARGKTEDPWLEAIKACEGISDRNGSALVEQTAEGVVLIPSEIIVEARRVGIELPARANEMIQWLKRRYEVREARAFTRRAKLVVGMRLDGKDKE